LKPAQTNSLWDPILEKTYHKKRGGGVAKALRMPAWQAWGLEFKLQCHPKEEKKRNHAYEHLERRLILSKQLPTYCSFSSVVKFRPYALFSEKRKFCVGM
jgi:hypothetical protein